MEVGQVLRREALSPCIVHNILECVDNISFPYEFKRMRMLSKHSYVFFIH